MLDVPPVQPGSHLDLRAIPTEDDGGMDKDDAQRQFAELTKRLCDLQELLYAEHKHAVLVVLQAMDAGGKDSTIRHVFGPLNALGCHAFNFKAPSKEELNHDFLWRVHQRTPGKGHLHIFNRSHYEDVLIVRVKQLVEESRWKARYDHINAFEKMLADEGTTIVKFFLHISKEYQRRNLQDRLDDPKKNWKFNPDDLMERARWNDYQAAFEEALSRCSKPWAPWYIVPAEKKWYRNLVVASVMVRTLESLNMQRPAVSFDPKSIVIP